MNKVFLLWHDYVLNKCDAVKLLGVFTEHRLAEEARERLVLQPDSETILMTLKSWSTN